MEKKPYSPAVESKESERDGGGEAVFKTGIESEGSEGDGGKGRAMVMSQKMMRSEKMVVISSEKT